MEFGVLCKKLPGHQGCVTALQASNNIPCIPLELFRAVCDKSPSRYPAFPMEWEKKKRKILFISVVTGENQEFLASPDNYQACLSLPDSAFSQTQAYRLIPRDCFL